jgi:hypothetical protein
LGGCGGCRVQQRQPGHARQLDAQQEQVGWAAQDVVQSLERVAGAAGLPAVGGPHVARQGERLAGGRCG